MSTVSPHNGTHAVTEPGAELHERLADPKTTAALTRLLDRLDVICFLLEAADGFLRRGEVVTDSLAESIAELRQFDSGMGDVASKLPGMARTGGQLADLAERADWQAVTDSRLVERLTDPTTLAQLNQLLDRLEVADFALSSLNGFLSRGEQITDSLADVVGEMKRLDVHESARDLVQLVTKDLPQMTEAANRMIRSGMLNPDVVGTLGEIGAVVATAHHEAKQHPPEPVGLFGLLRAMRDPQIQAALAMGLHIAKRLGEHLSRK